MTSIDKINSILKVTNRKYKFYEAKDKELLILTKKGNTPAIDFLYQQQVARERRLINHLINILKNRENRLKFSLLFDVYGLDSEKEKLNEIRKIWEG